MKKKTGKSTALKKIKIREKKKPIMKITDTNSLIEYALKNKSGIESLKEILKMKHDEEARQAEKMFHINFCKMQEEFPVIPKNKKVGNAYSYSSMSKIVPIVKPIISKHGFAYRWTKEFPDEEHIIIIFHLTGYGHTETCSMKLPIMESTGFTNAIQQSGSTSTYGERYTFCGMLGIVSDEDDDGRGSTQPATKPTNEPPKNITPEVIPPSKPKLPEKIMPDDDCKLGRHKEKPIKFKDVPLGDLIAFQNQASNPEALSTVIHFALDEKVMNLRRKLEYKEADISALIKTVLKLETDYLDLKQADKIKVYKELKSMAEAKK